MKEKELHGDRKTKRDNDRACLVLYNDDFNTFDHVIKALVEICGHDPVQAEQCAMLVHLKGSCDVKLGLPSTLTQMSKSLSLKGLKSEVLPLS